MIHPTRTELRQLRDQASSVTDSVGILRARRLALIRAFLASVRPLLRSREAIRGDYARAIRELALSEGHEGMALIEALAATAGRPVGADVEERNAMGVRYRELQIYGPFVRGPAERDHDYTLTTPHLDESIHGFESVLESLLELAAFESKLKMLGEEVQRVTRRTQVLEERELPRLKRQIRAIAQYLGERERESHYRLKKFKQDRESRRARGGSAGVLDGPRGVPV